MLLLHEINYVFSIAKIATELSINPNTVRYCLGQLDGKNKITRIERGVYGPEEKEVKDQESLLNKTTNRPTLIANQQHRY